MSVSKGKYKKITTNSLQEMKRNGEKISMLTAYDYTLAKIVDSSGVDIILVGDSASNVMAGHETTLPITLNEMIYHAASVVRATNRCLVVVDMLKLKYAHMLIVVTFLVVNFFGFLVITRDHGSFEGSH